MNSFFSDSMLFIVSRQGQGWLQVTPGQTEWRWNLSGYELVITPSHCKAQKNREWGFPAWYHWLPNSLFSTLIRVQNKAGISSCSGVTSKMLRHGFFWGLKFSVLCFLAKPLQFGVGFPAYNLLMSYNAQDAERNSRQMELVIYASLGTEAKWECL